MAYQYRFNLPPGLSNDQDRQLISLARTTAQNASVVDTGAFRRGWTASIRNSVLTVSNSIFYAIYLEMGTVHNRRHRYRVRDALNRIGFDVASPIISDPEIASEVERANTNENPQGDQVLVNETEQSGTGTFQPASNIEGANPVTGKTLFLPSDDPSDILFNPIGSLTH